LSSALAGGCGQLACHSVAIPAISTGIVDYPLLLSIDSSLFWSTVGYRDRCAVGAEA
jgi:hypothetical protein